MPSKFQKKRFFFASTPLVLGALLIFALVISPLILIVSEVNKPPSDGWAEISQVDPGGIFTRLGLTDEIPEHSNLYLRTKSTLIMLAGVGTTSALLGITLAWIVSVWEFPFRKSLSFLLVLPLTIPSYIAATAFKLLSIDHKNSFSVSFREKYGAEAMIEMDQYWNFSLAILVLSLGFYPYVYIAARTAFSTLSQSYLDSARSLGKKQWQSFLFVAVPLARPAILGGLILVLLETLNEYGAMQILGINTLTTEIFYAWINLEDKGSAFRLAGCIMIIVFILLLAEVLLRGGKRFHAARSNKLEFQGSKLNKFSAILCMLFCLGVFALAFALPLTELIRLAYHAFPEVGLQKFMPFIISSVSLAGIASLVIMTVSLFLGYAYRIVPKWWMQPILKGSNLGYAIPGAILGIALIGSAAVFQKSDFLFPILQYVFYTSIIGIIVAYMIRFLTVGLNPVEAGLKSIHNNLDEASYSLGKGPIKTFFKIHLPLLKYAISGGLLILFIDILKELPLTLIMNQETLATKTYSLFAKEERYAEGAIPALLLILTGIVGLAIIRSFFKELKN